MRLEAAPLAHARGGGEVAEPFCLGESFGHGTEHGPTGRAERARGDRARDVGRAAEQEEGGGGAHRCASARVRARASRADERARGVGAACASPAA